jgi:hypothetical protein
MYGAVPNIKWTRFPYCILLPSLRPMSLSRPWYAESFVREYIRLFVSCRHPDAELAKRKVPYISPILVKLSLGGLTVVTLAANVESRRNPRRNLWLLPMLIKS